jgi:hypothetical protein
MLLRCRLAGFPLENHPFCGKRVRHQNGIVLVSTKDSVVRFGGLLTTPIARRWPWSPRPTDPASGTTALALSIALLRALRDRGVLSRAELDDVLHDAASHFDHGKVSHLIEEVRADLDRPDED